MLSVQCDQLINPATCPGDHHAQCDLTSVINRQQIRFQQEPVLSTSDHLIHTESGTLRDSHPSAMLPSLIRASWIFFSSHEAKKKSRQNGKLRWPVLLPCLQFLIKLCTVCVDL